MMYFSSSLQRGRWTHVNTVSLHVIQVKAKHVFIIHELNTIALICWQSACTNIICYYCSCFLVIYRFPNAQNYSWITDWQVSLRLAAFFPVSCGLSFFLINIKIPNLNYSSFFFFYLLDLKTNTEATLWKKTTDDKFSRFFFLWKAKKSQPCCN